MRSFSSIQSIHPCHSSSDHLSSLRIRLLHHKCSTHEARGMRMGGGKGVPNQFPLARKATYQCTAVHKVCTKMQAAYPPFVHKGENREAPDLSALTHDHKACWKDTRHNPITCRPCRNQFLFHGDDLCVGLVHPIFAVLCPSEHRGCGEGSYLRIIDATERGWREAAAP